MPNIFHNSLSLGYGGGAPTPSYPTDGLIARYSFDDDLTDSYDSMGNLTQYSTGTQYWSYSTDKPSGVSGKSFKTGPNDVVGNSLKNATDASVYGLANGTNDFSLSCWVKIDNASADLSYFWSFYSTGTNRIGLATGGVSYNPPATTMGTLFIATGSVQVVENADYRASNAWRHYVYTYNGTTQKVYVDNVEKYSGARGSLSSSNKLNIGSANGSWSIASGNGYMDLLYLYNKALSGEEISQLWNGGAGV